jgi:nicotinamide-nucleotide amidase
MVIAKIISIGDELLNGQIVNSNATFISGKLSEINIKTEKISVIGDNEDDLLSELDYSLLNCDLTILTGGLGPTHDDITKSVLLKFFDDELILNEDVLEHIKKIFSNRNIKMPDRNIEQAMVPSKCRVIWNKFGTAPGLWFEKNKKIFIALPGVPYETIEMINKILIPDIKKYYENKFDYFFKSRTLLTLGIGESSLAEKIGDAKKIVGENKLAFLPSVQGVKLRIDAYGKNEKEVDFILDEISEKIKDKVGKYIWGENDDSLEIITGNLLTKLNYKIATAESCTGGLISKLFTDIPGSSKYFIGGVFAYSNNVKINSLGVNEKTIIDYGAVSEQTAKEMADGIRKKFNTDIGISTTGIAGPEGGTKEKPVGLVWIGYSDKNKTYAEKFNFGTNRERTRLRASYYALNILRKEILFLF